MSTLDQKPTRAPQNGMSALLQKQNVRCNYRCPPLIEFAEEAQRYGGNSADQRGK
jgi:hypothetical protein